MDPVGMQKKIKGNEHHVGFEKLLKNGGDKENYGFNVKGGKTRKVDSGQAYRQDQGKVRGGIKHTYGVDGENDND